MDKLPCAPGIYLPLHTVSELLIHCQ